MRISIPTSFMGWIGEMARRRIPRLWVGQKSLASSKNELFNLKISRNDVARISANQGVRAPAFRRVRRVLRAGRPAAAAHGVMIYGDREKRLERLPKPAIPAPR
jgi:hypothetical protein